MTRERIQERFAELEAEQQRLIEAAKLNLY